MSAEQLEREALRAAQAAKAAIERAISAYEAAGYGSHVTQPLRSALESVEFSINEVQS